ncbi:MAG: YihY/virulence factor BrkB family protein [Microthrixaceae bacterium]
MQQDHGRSADRPGEIPARGWRDALTRVKVESTNDQVSLLGAGVAFFFLLSLVPTLIAAISVYGLVSNPAQVQRQIEDVAEGLPSSARDLLVEQVSAVTDRSTAGLSVGAIVAIALALWSASAGVRHLIEALNAAYGEEESRGPVRLYAQALVLATGGIVGGALIVGVISIVPALLDETSMSAAANTALSLLRWPLLAVVFAVALGVLYRVGPDRDTPRTRWVSWGAVSATGLWLLASAAFSIYAERFASFDTYGSLAGVIVLMLWLQLTAVVILLGAELNCELERQTTRDSTVGRPEALGRRDAHAADTVGPSAEQVTAG